MDDTTPHDALERLQAGIERTHDALDRMESMLHRVLHGSEPNTPGIYKRLGNVEAAVDNAKSGLRWVVGIFGAILTAIVASLFGRGDS